MHDTVTCHLFCLGTDPAAPGPAEERAASPATSSAVGRSAEEEAAPSKNDESDDDLMITLDENATAYEPVPKRVHRSSLPGLRPSEPGGPPGLQELPGLGFLQGFSAPASSQPAFGGPGQGPRPGIGGLPRSAIPGLGGMPAALRPPSGQAAPVSDEPPAFPSEAGPTQPIKLPGQVCRTGVAGVQATGYCMRRLVFGKPPALFLSPSRPTTAQTRVTPEEYKEFLSLGHGEIFNLDIDRVVDAPWRLPGIDISDFFNYGMNHRAWKEYCQQIQQYREEFSMQVGVGGVVVGGDWITGRGMGGRKRVRCEPRRYIVVLCMAARPPVSHVLTSGPLCCVCRTASRPWIRRGPATGRASSGSQRPPLAAAPTGFRRPATTPRMPTRRPASAPR